MPLQERRLPVLGPHGFYNLAYFEWGDDPAADVLVCVHGLTRRGRDFDVLAGAMADRYRVLCPDMPGRGRSDWFEDKTAYDYAAYMGAGAALVARSGAAAVDWVGTSMGGLIGMFLAAQANTPIRRLVLNDIGPFLPKEALNRIAMYTGLDERFPSFEALEAYVRDISAGFGKLTDAQWRFLAEHYARQLPDGSWAAHYDPGIGVNMRKVQVPTDVELWALWAMVKCPVLVIRGGDSDLLTAETAERMKDREAPTTVVTLPGIGHAPALLADDQVAIIRDWLLG